MKQINPYNRLKEQFRSWVNRCLFRRKVVMWVYPKKDLSAGWNLSDLYERTAAAEQLGYDVMLIAKEEGLVVQYVEKIPAKPWNL